MSSVQQALPGTASLQRSAPGSVGRELDRMLAGLNGPQRQAVVHEGSPLLIVAGAGSGKTRVLAHRIAYLLGARGAQPGEILAITFTNKAAGEMRSRVAELIGGRANAMWVSTFHSMCVRILRAQAKQIGLKSSFTIYDADDARRLQGARGRVLVEEQITEETADERADDPQHDRADDAHGVTARHDGASDETGDGSDDDQRDDETQHGATPCRGDGSVI